MRRLPIRARLTLAFAAAMAVVIALAGSFVYVRVGDDLAETIDDGLRTRVDDVARSLAGEEVEDVDLGTPDAEGAEDSITQVVGADDTVLASSEATGGGPVLDPGRLAEARAGLSYFDADSVPGVEGGVRLLARPAPTDEGDVVVVAGASTEDRAETLSVLLATFAVGGPIALLLASALGYGLATLALRPVEDMRRRAEEVTLRRAGERLPLPDSEDEIRRLGETLNAMLERIEGSLERERGFVADASHELRTPLAIARAELELGTRPDRSPEEAAAAMRSAAEEVERLQALADDLLLLARSEERRLPLELEEADPRALLEAVGERFRARAADAGREIAIEARPGLRARLDPARVEAAVGNLVENALRHGGGRVLLAASEEEDVLRLSVSDEGDGFPEGFAERAFERFSRPEGGRTQSGGGLGLAIVSAIAEAHGGSASIDAAPGGGATVVIEIPASESKP